MGFFDQAKPKISERDFKKVIENLHSKGWGPDDINRAKLAFHGSMNESGQFKGIDKSEAEETIAWMRDNKSQHGLSDHHIDTLHEELNRHFHT